MMGDVAVRKKVGLMDDRDFFDPDVVECPFAFYQAVRKDAPVLELIEPESKRTLFLVTRYDLVADVLKNPALFSSRFMNPIGREKTDSEVEAVYSKAWPWVDTLLTSDPPKHRRYRALVNRAFTAKRVRTLTPFIEALANALIDAFEDPGDGTGTCEFIASYARPLPLRVIADQFGVPDEDLPDFKRWSDSFVARLGGLLTKDEEVACARDVVALQHYLKNRIDDCRATPRDHIMSDLVHAGADGEAPLSDAELINMLQQLLVAGNETTANTLAGGLMSLLQDAESRKSVNDDSGLIAGLVEESLRTVTAQSGMWRIATGDTELAGQPIPKGATLLLRYDAGNRDPAVFPDPEVFDIRRPKNPTHLSFGMGVHFCVGAQLARTELEIGFKVLFARLKDIRLAPDNDYKHQPNMMLRGLKRLNIAYAKREEIPSRL